MKAYNVICRRANEKDDIRRIAKYLYLTDAYIYPTVCDAYDDAMWESIVSACYVAENNIFSMNNLLVAELDGRVVGILCILPCGQRNRFLEDVPDEIAHHPGLMKAQDGYFGPLIDETLTFGGFNITNLCIDAALQGKGIGARLLDYCLECYGDAKIHLDVIADNLPAVHLYQKMGFTVTTEYNGFSGSDRPLPCYHMERSARKD